MNKLLILFLLLGGLQLTAQKSDRTLFTVENQPVTLSEFEYIYNKNNRDGADYSKSSLEEYLDLYIKFKLKVQKAKDMQLDTIQSLIQELKGYRKQLASGYLNDKEVKDKLVREAYDRMQEDVRFSHILVFVGQNAPLQDTAAAYAQIMEAYKQLENGNSFENVAKMASQDVNTKDNGGDAGFMSAMLPSGFYAVENAIYGEIGKYSKPVRSTIGYHIIKPTERRPARGNMEVSHLLVRINASGSNSEISKQKINDLYAQIQKGESFEELARKYSEDETTARKNGFIGTLGINMFEQSFEDAAFALEKDGDISAPVQTSLGWHIIKRVQKKPAEPFEFAKRRLEAQVTKNERIDAATLAMIERIKKEGGFELDKEVYNHFIQEIEGDLFNYRWQPPADMSLPLFSFGGEMPVTTDEFGQFMRAQSRLRMKMPKTATKEEVANSLLSEFIKEKTLAYEESKLADKYPDFKALMREYEEGILLFEATKINVWDKASSDTVGLKEYYQAHKNDFMWEERANVVTYTLPAGDIKMLNKFKKLIPKLPAEKLVAKLNKKQSAVSYASKKVLKTDSAMKGLEWVKGSMAEGEPNTEKNTLSFKVVESIVPPEPKSLAEARGYIIADYQDELEKRWIAQLKNEYKITVNDPVFQSLIKR